MKLSIYGGTGIIGSFFSTLYDCEIVKREELIPQHENVLYLISTTTNSTDTPWVDTDTNLTQLMKRLCACKEAGVKTFNFVSSWFVYGNAFGVMSPKSACFPAGIYSLTKYFAEELVINFCEENDIDYRIMRLGNIYGGPDDGSKKRNVLHYLIGKLKENEPIEVVANMTRDYLHIVDACRAIYAVCKSDIDYEILNIGSGISRNVADVLEEAKRIIGSSSEIVRREPYGNEESVYMALDCSHLIDMAFIPVIDFATGLKDLCTSRTFSTPGHILMDKKFKQLLTV